MKDYSRRQHLRLTLLAGGAAIGAAAGLSACSGDKKDAAGGAAALSCTDTTGLSPADIATRNALQYVDKTPEAGKDCNNCNLYVAAAAAGSCGTCKILKGPVHPKGYCKSWVAKPAS